MKVIRKETFRAVYVNRFGAHCCGSIIQYGGGSEKQRAAAGGGEGAGLKSLRMRRKHVRYRWWSDDADRRQAGGSRAELGRHWQGATRGERQGRGKVAAGTTQSSTQEKESEEGGNEKLRAAQSRVMARKCECKAEVSRMQKKTCKPGSGISSAQGSPLLQCSKGRCANSWRNGVLPVTKYSIFGFHSSLHGGLRVKKRKQKKSTGSQKVLKVISRMLEENEKLRIRLLTCSQIYSEE
ncbi:uncharacterized protein C5orf47 homolog [Microcaecilia unicolor]|uniref:Uncharacterized protein LOC115476858 n=1 Tax=Microcaecilia unicolor TaxID=1415580 RepID=A0A6P7YPW7_9AMPH|nr:uncharacterized protein LOC115476858 [Microcaecilia unicolor]